MRRRLPAVLLAALAAVAAAALGVPGSAAQFTAAATVGGNAVTVDGLRNYFAVTPGTVTQPGTATPVATGGVDTLALAFGTVPKAQTFADVFTIRNVSTATQTATLEPTGAPQVASVAFASTGTTSATLAAGASTTVSVTTSSTVAGVGAGTLRLRLGDSTWLYRDYPLTLAEAPEAPASLTATQRPAGAIELVWAASSTTTNLAGYDVYRDGAEVASTPAGTTGWTDTATSDGSSYTYTVVADSTDTPPLGSLASPAATQTADATPPPRPTSVSLASGYVNAANRSSFPVSFTLAPGALASDTETVVVSDGAGHQATRTVTGYGAGGVTVSGLDASGLVEGALSVSVTAVDAAGNVSAAGTATAVKDTIAPSAPTATYVDNKNSRPDTITGTAEPGARITIVETQPRSQTFTGTAGGGGYSIDVDGVKHQQVAYTVTATDAAGNTSAATAVDFDDRN